MGKKGGLCSYIGLSALGSGAVSRGRSKGFCYEGDTPKYLVSVKSTSILDRHAGQNVPFKGISGVFISEYSW